MEVESFSSLEAALEFLCDPENDYFGATVTDHGTALKSRFGWHCAPWSVAVEWMADYGKLIGQDVASLPSDAVFEETLTFASGNGPFRLRTILSHGLEGWDLVLRLLPNAVFTQEQVRLPQAIVDHFLDLKEGLVLVSGATGSGKSSTMAFLIDHRLKNRSQKLFSAENPIEYVHQANESSVVKQIEVGADKSVATYTEAVRLAMRQDPDIIMLQELRTPAEAVAALDAAMTGHVVVASVHAPDPIATIQRFTRWLEIHQGQAADTGTLGRAIQLVISQRMHVQEDRYAPIHEILVPNKATANAIANKDFNELRLQMDTGQANGMVTFKNSTEELLYSMY